VAHIGDADVPFRLVRVPRRRTTGIVVTADLSVEVRGPCRCTLSEAHALLVRHGPWVQRTLQRLRAAARRPVLADGTPLPLLDDVLTLRLGPGSAPVVDRAGDELWLRGAPLDPAGLNARLAAWYRQQARGHLPARLDELARALALRPRAVSIRGQRTRWGSCSGRGTISLNWRLMLVPLSLVDYVLVHEVCHLRHLSHSPAFWALVADAMPDWRERRARLRAIQGTLPL
jgi:hypothetical protein